MGQEAAHHALRTPSYRVCKNIRHDENIQVLSPSGPFLTGPLFSRGIPTSFQTFLVNLWTPESVCCILDISPGAHLPRNLVQVQVEAGGLLQA